MSYGGRPGVSPVIATLFAAGRIRRSHAVLDIGCGDGTDCIALALWGVHRVAGLDLRERALRKGERRAAQYGVSEIEFHGGSITNFHECFADASFDVAIDSVCWNNVHADAAQATPGYVRQVWRLLKPGGMFVLQARDFAHRFAMADGEAVLPGTFGQYFALGPALVTQLPERRTEGGPRTWANVSVCIGRRRARPLKR